FESLFRWLVLRPIGEHLLELVNNDEEPHLFRLAVQSRARELGQPFAILVQSPGQLLDSRVVLEVLLDVLTPGRWIKPDDDRPGEALQGVMTRLEDCDRPGLTALDGAVLQAPHQPGAHDGRFSAPRWPNHGKESHPAGRLHLAPECD